jgi:hypothetical protein
LYLAVDRQPRYSDGHSAADNEQVLQKADDGAADLPRIP